MIVLQIIRFCLLFIAFTGILVIVFEGIIIPILEEFIWNIMVYGQFKVEEEEENKVIDFLKYCEHKTL